MKSSAFAAISSCVLFFMVIVVSPKLVSTAPSESDSGTSKTKREAGGPSGLFPFPRIGRSGTDTWFFDTSDNAQNYAKRQGLVPFPRLGRLQKRDAMDSPWALVTLRGQRSQY
uniref:Cardioacceleratory peptide 2b splicing variant a n=1 Tax=Nilaparvata lugens TaxID=108931 RepID=U3U7C0_NILLU|nr:cardioacceleratory peptide 2b splicing variant a [Nilaparvata lugens]